MDRDLHSDLVKKLGLKPAEAQALVSGQGKELTGERSLALIAFDAESIHAQLFASPRPVTIQGASVTLARWDEELPESFKQAVVLYAGGGTALLLADVEDVWERHLCERIEAKYREMTGGSPCSAAASVFTLQELASGPRAASLNGLSGKEKELLRGIGWDSEAGGGFGACLAWVYAELRRKRGLARPHPVLGGPTNLARCEECAERPRAPSGKLCARCAQNRRTGGEKKLEWDSEQAKTYNDVLKTKNDQAQQIAFLYLDGKGIGAVLEKLRTIDQYVIVSKLLHRAFHFSPEKVETLSGLDCERMQIPLSGGDDLMLVVPATWKIPNGRGNALRLCETILSEIESVFDRLSEDELSAFASDKEILNCVKNIGAGAGVVITSGLPAAYCFEYASKLVDSSKKVIPPNKGRPNEVRSAVDYIIFKGGSPSSSSLEELEEKNRPTLNLSPSLKGEVRLTHRPYSLQDYRELLKRAGQLKALQRSHRSALYGLRKALEEPNTGLLHIRYQLAREKDLRLALTGKEPLDPGLPLNVGPWVLEQSKFNKELWEAGLPDLLDVLNLVEPSKDEASDE